MPLEIAWSGKSEPSFDEKWELGLSLVSGMIGGASIEQLESLRAQLMKLQKECTEELHRAKKHAKEEGR